ncbi:MAG: CdaR family protein [Verrucomicrobia bacterium]|nr:CdaR family protein [Verrucomicrobiota bacterium]
MNIVRASARREWKGLKVLAIQEAGGMGDVYVTPARVDVTVEGRAEVVENLAEQDVRIFVDCIGLNADAAYELPVQVHLPVYNDVTVKVIPKTVAVTFGDANKLKGPLE